MSQREQLRNRDFTGEGDASLSVRFSQCVIPITRVEREEPRFLDQYDKTGRDAVRTQSGHKRWAQQITFQRA